MKRILAAIAAIITKARTVTGAAFIAVCLVAAAVMAAGVMAIAGAPTAAVRAQAASTAVTLVVITVLVAVLRHHHSETHNAARIERLLNLVDWPHPMVTAAGPLDYNQGDIRFDPSPAIEQAARALQDAKRRTFDARTDYLDAIRPAHVPSAAGPPTN